MNNPKVAVIMSCYNNEDTVKSSVESILNQTYRNFEFYIVDDCSEDRTHEVLNELSKKDSRLIISKNDSNLGLTKSLNILINNTASELVARQDADDISNPKRLKYQIDYLNKKNLDAITSRAKRNDNNSVIPRMSYYLPKKLILKFKNPYIHGTLLIKREVLKSLHGYDENFIYAQDYKLITDLINKGYRIKILKRVLYNLNMKNNISSNKKKDQAYFAKCVRKGILPNGI
tara:strand:+ start:292 stop:984 length:693 start_codon:yes stop_codon:yes gene_type:complete